MMTRSGQRRGLQYVSRKVLAERGYTLVELVVVMVIFMVIMLVTSNSFNTIVTHARQQSKSMETEIGSIIGLEAMRSDLQNAGYGLPWIFDGTPSASKYVEVTTADATMPVSAPFWPTATSPRTFNDAPANVPRAVQSSNTTFNIDANGQGSKYLVVKSLSIAPGATQKKWVTVTFGDAGRNPLATYGVADRDLAPTDKVIVLRNTFSDDGMPSRRLQVQSGVFSTAFSNYTALTVPHSSGDVFEVYGVDPSNDPRMPFNRADYYVATPAKMPPACAPNTGILYKAVLSQVPDMGYTQMPLLDCVADMQVVYGSGPAGSNQVNLHSTSLPGTGSAADIRSQLKEIRIYILGHEGKKDTSFTYPNKLVPVGEDFGGGLLGRSFDLEALIKTGWQNYRWKVYTIVARPKNLIQ